VETPLLFPLDLLGGTLQARINELPSSTIQKIGEADGRLAWVDRSKGKFIHYGRAQASMTRHYRIGSSTRALRQDLLLVYDGEPSIPPPRLAPRWCAWDR
jgi:hypothetical protein